jgi:hypothetical protein
VFLFAVAVQESIGRTDPHEGGERALLVTQPFRHAAAQTA